MLEDDFLAGHWRQVRMDLALRAVFKALALPPPPHDPAIQVARMVHVLGEDHGAARSAKGIYEPLGCRKDRHASTRERRGCRIEEEPLHVDHQQDARPHVQPHLMLVVWTDLVQPRQSLGSDVLGRRIWFHDSSLNCALVRLTIGCSCVRSEARQFKPGLGGFAPERYFCL